jgi:hypothetical protein
VVKRQRERERGLARTGTAKCEFGRERSVPHLRCVRGVWTAMAIQARWKIVIEEGYGEIWPNVYQSGVDG